MREAKFDHREIRNHHDASTQLEQWIARALDIGFLALKTEISSIDPMQAKLCGIALAVAPNEAAYLPLGHREAGERERATPACSRPSSAPVKFPRRMRSPLLKPVLEDLSVIKIGHNVKQDWLVLACRGIRLGAVDDTMLMSYVLDAGKGAHDMDSVAKPLFRPQPFAL